MHFLMMRRRYQSLTDTYEVGIGLRAPHFPEIFAHRPQVGWFEIIAENYMRDGGRPLANLDRILSDYRVIVHSVGLYLGSAQGVDPAHVKRLKTLLRRTQSPWVTDHLCWGSVDGTYSHDLLPLPYTNEIAHVVAENARRVQDELEVPLGIENLSSYAEFKASTLTEWEFLSLVAEKADVGLLLDVNNIYVSSVNHGFDPYVYLNHLPWDRVLQIHVAGHARFDHHIIDTHDHPVADPVWDLYAYAMEKLGPTPTLLEWDARLPSFSRLQAEAQRAYAHWPQAEKKVACA